MNLLFWKIKYSLDEIKEKRPNRLDYINSMTDSLQWLGDAMEVYKILEDEYRLSKSRCFDLELINMKLIDENQKLIKNGMLSCIVFSIVGKKLQIII